jgi:hypothetical protein
MAYLPSGAPDRDPVAVEKLEWENGFEADGPEGGRRLGKRLAEFQVKWESVIREWSLRWGRRVSGWWIDGCYFPDEMYRHPSPPNFESLFAALRAGNRDRILAFNAGPPHYPVRLLTEQQDYLGGHCPRTALNVCTGPRVNGTQYHALAFLGSGWGVGPPRFCAELVAGYTKDTVEKGGVVTWDVPVRRDGAIEREFLDRLAAIPAALCA